MGACIYIKVLNYVDVINVQTIVKQCNEMLTLTLQDCFLSCIFLIYLIPKTGLVLLAQSQRFLNNEMFWNTTLTLRDDRVKRISSGSRALTNLNIISKQLHINL